jgi:oxygen-dependent protoporphyrinogen oxidase
LPDGTASLAGILADALVRRGVVIHTATPVAAVERSAKNGNGAGAARWHLSLGRGAGSDGPASFNADAVILAVPAPEAAVLLVPFAPEAAGLLSAITYGSVAVVTMALPPDSVGIPLEGTGFLVPRTSTLDGRPALITGVTYLGRKWPHLARPGDELVRASVGRFGDNRHAGLDDEALIAAVVAELAALVGLRGAPLEATVTRWDASFPQYEVGHLVRVSRVEQLLAGLGTVAVAGAALRGVGIPACIGSGRSAAVHVRDGLTDRAGRPS